METSMLRRGEVCSCASTTAARADKRIPGSGLRARARSRCLASGKSCLVGGGQAKFPNIQSKPPLAQLEAISSLFEVQPHQCRVQGDDHFPSPAGHTIPDTSQDAIGLPGHLGTLLAHIQPAVNQHPQVLFHQAAFQPLFPKPVALHGVVVAQVQDPALGLVEPHTIGPSPSIQPVQVPLQSLPTLKQINTPTQLGVICKLTEGARDPFIQITDKHIKQDWPRYRALGDTTC
ncbi:hypothetical protein QYF61_027750 [Mycteria americana]|uniref:Uncharacterized protein n=1 Tax=Mycteria americana TaxID=33587 RepID=A0AAN7NY41_MYCAM|nr:hypothetical protein QYF61_027750 [Mycteria americana]